MKTFPVLAIFSFFLTARSQHIRDGHYKRQGAAAPAAPPAAAPPAAAGGSGDVPPLTAIVSNMPPGPTLAVPTYPPGATPPIPGAPPIPTFAYVEADWPPRDKIPDTTSPQVQQWMKELDGVQIPNLSVTKDGTCENDTAAAADAANRGWWTCGGYIRDTDVSICPDKLDWGLNFDDGPSAFTPELLNYLTQQKLKATFFVVGSRVVQNPNILVHEYMSGHEISVHTWSHRPLTSLTNEQVVAELGWTRESVRKVLGVSTLSMRPPYGDIDDRVRAISMAMGMVPMLWTRGAGSFQYDTADWEVAAGSISAPTSVANFNLLLSNASALNTGVIVLQHDLYDQTVDLARGYYIPAALNYQPPFKLKAIGECLKWPPGNLYLETKNNNQSPTSLGATTNTSVASPSSSAASVPPAVVTSASLSIVAPAISAIFFGMVAAVCGFLA